jgi:hypothetical protein
MAGLVETTLAEAAATHPGSMAGRAHFRDAEEAEFNELAERMRALEKLDFEASDAHDK